MRFKSYLNEEIFDDLIEKKKISKRKKELLVLLRSYTENTKDDRYFEMFKEFQEIERNEKLHKQAS